MRGVFLLLPFLLIRFGLLSLMSREAVRRAAHFPPLVGMERTLYWVYQLATLGLLFVLPFLLIQREPSWLLLLGLCVYVAGLILLAFSVLAFARTSLTGMNEQGLYRLSRNPMYLAYFVCFMGCVLLTHSWLLLGLVVVFLFATHWMILAEERWCLQEFGEAYALYRRRVRRYL